MATINIFGDIGNREEYGEYGVKQLTDSLNSIGDDEEINVHINSFGGDVAEGLAIYNTLKNHKAKITTYCDGFACSIASVIFMAGSYRKMNEASLLMIHQASCGDYGNADDKRKMAEVLETVTQQSINVYKSTTKLSENKIKELIQEETWISPEQALKWGFATEILKLSDNSKYTQNVKNKILGKLLDNNFQSLNNKDILLHFLERKGENK